MIDRIGKGGQSRKLGPVAAQRKELVAAGIAVTWQPLELEKSSDLVDQLDTAGAGDSRTWRSK